jgi:hypothetical protein
MIPRFRVTSSFRGFLCSASFAATFLPTEEFYSDNLTDDQKMTLGSRMARQGLAEDGLKLMRQHPVFGAGPGIFAAAAAYHLQQSRAGSLRRQSGVK